MKRALDRGVTNWAYVKAILQSWKNKGIKTVEDVLLEEIEFKENQNNKRKQSYYAEKVKPIEKNVPAWFEERKRENARLEKLKQREMEKELEQMSDPKYAEHLEKELERLLKGLGG